MANELKKLITAAGKKKFEDELASLIEERHKVSKEIGVAREQGDLSENADYDAAKDRQSEVEHRILELQALLENYRILNDGELDPSVINVGCVVTLYDKNFDEEIVYTIVGAPEADSRKRLISYESPVGKALLGYKAGDSVSVDLGDNVLDLEILNLEY